MKKNLIRFSTLVVILTLMITGYSYAQRVTGKITGVVTDDEGVPIPGVTVEISSPALMGGIHSQVTSDKGIYRFLNLSPGTYTVVFKLQGFQTITRENVRVSIDSTVTENIMIKPAAIEEAVTVTAVSPIVDVESSATSTTYDRDLMEKLPTARFTYFDIIKQNPGFTTNYGDASSRISAFGSNSRRKCHVHGWSRFEQS